MTDIIKRLQNLRFVLISLDEIQTVNEAIEEIERLRKALAAPSAAWDGFLVSGMSDSVEEVLRLVAESKTGNTSCRPRRQP